MSYQDIITIEPDKRGGKPCIRGMRITVYDVLEYLASGMTEVQILEDHGKPPNSHSNGALYSRIAPSVNASKPPDEWQSYDIRRVGRQVTVVLNDQKIIDKQEIEGLTAIAGNADEGKPGPLILQGDHGPVEFRKITVIPLVK